MAKMLPPHNMPLQRLSQQQEISIGTLSRWRAEARARGLLHRLMGHCPAVGTQEGNTSATGKIACPRLQPSYGRAEREISLRCLPAFSIVGLDGVMLLHMVCEKQ